MRALHILRLGWQRAAANWPALLALYLVSLASGMLAAGLPILELLGPAHYTVVSEAAAGIPAWLLGETLLSPLNNFTLASGTNGRVLSGAVTSFLTGVGIQAALLPLLAWLPGSLVSGGALLSLYHSAQAQVVAPDLAEHGPRFDWKRFAWGCWHFWGTYLVWGLLQGVLSGAVLAAGLIAFALGISFNLWAGLILGIAGLLLIGTWTAYAELVQVSLAAGRKGQYGRALRQAWGGLRRQGWSLMAFYGLSLGLLLALHLVFRAGIFPRLPLALWPLVLTVQQAFIFLHISARLARLAGDVEYLPVGDG